MLVTQSVHEVWELSAYVQQRNAIATPMLQYETARVQCIQQVRGKPSSTIVRCVCWR